MYENVVAILLSKRPGWKSRARDRRADDDFYRRLAHPYPHWFGWMIGLRARPETKRGGIAATPNSCRNRFPNPADQNSDHSCLTAALPRVAGAV